MIPMCFRFFVLFVGVLMFFGTLYDYIVYQKELEGELNKIYYEKQSEF